MTATPPPRWGSTTAAAAAHFDYAAIRMETMMCADAVEFAQQKSAFAQCGITPEVCISILPPDVVVTAPGFNLYHWLGYVQQGLQRLAAVGCRALLWRDGAARALPLEGDITAAKAQCLQFVYMLCRQCEEYEMTLMIEPRPAAETNHLNTLAEVEALITHIGKDNLQPALHWADAAALSAEVNLAQTSPRLWHISAPALPPAPLPVLQTTAEQCAITLLDDADTDALDALRRQWR